MNENSANSYRVLLTGGEGEYVEKKSRFIATIRKCESEEEASAFIDEMKKKYWDAKHNCSAFVIGSRGELTRCSDDGEPSGTAGRPMLEVLTGEGIRNIAVVVTRYFGGVLLGTGGLVRAYSSSISQALKVATLTTVTTLQEFQIHFSYDLIGKIDHYFRTQNIEVIEQQYEEDVVYHFLVLEDISKDLMELTNGKIKIQYIQDIETECVI